MVKKILKALLIIVIALVVIVGVYVAYVFISYDRIEDNQILDVQDNVHETLTAGESKSIISWNIGFAAYSRDYSFFMDGGKYSRAYSRQAVIDNLAGVTELLNENKTNFILLQEVDVDATRSYHVDEGKLIMESLGKYGHVDAINYDSAYLFYPILSPHGASKAQQMTLTSFSADSALRRSLPIETGFMKFFDLDRCYSITRIPVDNGKTLCLYNLHLSAYTSDGTIASQQLEMLSADMLSEYEKGNYVIAGGDFNKDLLGDSTKYFGVPNGGYTWAQPVDMTLIPEGISLIAPFDEENPVPSCRNCDTGYEPGKTFVLTVDGFLVSDNVTVSESRVIDAGFENSDHNPVYMEFTLEK